MFVLLFEEISIDLGLKFYHSHATDDGFDDELDKVKTRAQIFARIR